MELVRPGECSETTANDLSRFTTADEVVRPITGSREVEDIATITRSREVEDIPTTTSARVTDRTSTTTSPPLDTASPEEVTRIVLAEYACHLVDGRVLCYAPLQRRCVVLKPGADHRPSAALCRPASRGSYGACNGFEIFEQV